jgi:hypothetical protein
VYEPHPSFVQPPDESVKVWRYMDFTKFVSLIDSRRLFFSRADHVGDPFEGSWPRMNLQALQQLIKQAPPEHHQLFASSYAGMSRVYKEWLKFSAINCWHMNEHESAAMWKLYLKSNEGIAVQSTYQSLRDSLIDEEKAFLGIVKYIDYEKDSIDSANVFSAFVHKRKSFEHEREVRALVLKVPARDEETIAHGLKIKVDLERLVKAIYVAPSAPSWFAELVDALIQRYGYHFQVKHSNLDEQPLF